MKILWEFKLGSTVSIHNKRRGGGILKFNFYYLAP
jgi:hypothetical protein